MRSRCIECGKSLTRVSAQRIARGLPPLGRNSKTCGPACSREWRRRELRFYSLRAKNPSLAAERAGPIGWKCVVCGVDRATVDRKLKRLGLPPLHGNARLCSPECYRVRYERWLRLKRRRASVACKEMP
jgi:hypothetical protein